MVHDGKSLSKVKWYLNQCQRLLTWFPGPENVFVKEKGIFVVRPMCR